MEDVLNLRKKPEEKVEPIKKAPLVVKEKEIVKTTREISEEPIEDKEGDSMGWTIPAKGKSKTNLITGIILLVASILIWFLMKDALFALVLAIGGLILALGLNAQAMEEVSINDEEVSVGSSIYPYGKIEAFSINTLPNKVDELCLKLKSWYSPLIRIPIYTQDPTKVREAVVAFVPEKELEYSWLDIISSRLGF